MTKTPDAGSTGGAGKSRRFSLAWKVGLVVVLLGAALLFFRGGGDATTSGTTFAVRKGKLPITVLEGGSVEALESQVIKSQVHGQTKILSIVDEGYRVTKKDVENGLVLVTLDSSDIKEKLTQAEITFQNSAAMFTDAREQYEIQVKQNESDIKAAELDVKFARMDFEKYLGAGIASKIMKKLDLDKVEARIKAEAPKATASVEALQPPAAKVSPKKTEQPHEAKSLTPEMLDKIAGALSSKGAKISGDKLRQMAPKNDDGQPILTPRMRDRLKKMGVDLDTIVQSSPAEGAPVQSDMPALDNSPGDLPVTASAVDGAQGDGIDKVDFSKYADADLLEDGSAKQSLRQYTDDKMLAEEDLSMSKNQLDGTKKLAARDFVTHTELETDQMKVTRAQISLESANTALELFVKYEFPKQCEQLLSNYEEALRKLERVQKQAVSKLAQAAAKYKSEEAQYSLNKQRRDDLQEQIDNCVIRAERPGLVVYGGSERRRWSSNDQIEEGATVRERQEIITIPDMTQMGVNVSIHESAIKKIKLGQVCQIRVDAYPNKVLTGKVVKVDVLPDSQNRWLNPDLKVYTTRISIDGVYDWLKPGMSAQVEIMVNELDNVLMVPLQAVMQTHGEQVCYVSTSDGPERRPVKTGEFNNDFIEIKSGLKEGEKVYLRRPKEFQYEDDNASPDESDSGIPQEEIKAPATKSKST